MGVVSRDLTTARGDVVLMTLITHPGQRPSMLLTVAAPGTPAIPTAEFTLSEMGSFRETLRELCEAGTQGEGRVRR
ncbi:MAG: hypothetical protein ABSF84_02715 [Acidimicrobiales bacterium]|jgi:hypothetical protein